jgi:uncharacterized protein YceK
MQTIKLKVVVALFTVSLLSGCADMMGAVLNVQPGQTADLIAASSRQVTYEYTHSYTQELPAVGKLAEAQCNKFGKHAELGEIVRKNMDRSMVTFYCN